MVLSVESCCDMIICLVGGRFEPGSVRCQSICAAWIQEEFLATARSPTHLLVLPLKGDIAVLVISIICIIPPITPHIQRRMPLPRRCRALRGHTFQCLQ